MLSRVIKLYENFTAPVENRIIVRVTVEISHLRFFESALKVCESAVFADRAVD